jgi:para-nitrobenzyl esterase
MDVPFVFGNMGKALFSMDYSTQNEPGRLALSKVMMQSVGAFMKTGDPNNDALKAAGITWPKWTPGTAATNQNRMLFNATDTALNLSISNATQ